MKKSVFLVCILGLAIVWKVAWGIAYPSGTWRYKMTVEVETPEGIKTGSAVREVTVKTGVKLFSEGSSTVKSRGEAVIVDLGERGIFFCVDGRRGYINIKGFSGASTADSRRRSLL